MKMKKRLSGFVITFCLTAGLLGGAVTVNADTSNSCTVTYKVVNGTWSDNSTEDKKETVAAGDKPTQVPTGMKASTNGNLGVWNEKPGDATITEDTTFTYTFKPGNATVVTDSSLASETTVYAGEIFVDGVSKMHYLYSSDITNSESVFSRLKTSLKDTVFYGLVPVLGNDATGTGLAVSTSHQEDMGPGWTGAATVAGLYFKGTPGAETNRNMYDVVPSYKSFVDSNNTFTHSDGTTTSIGKRFSSTLRVSYGGSTFVDLGDNVVRRDLMILHNEATTVIYTSVNVTSGTTVNPGSDTTVGTNNGEQKTATEEAKSQVDAQPAEEKITISKKPTIKKPKAAKGRITVSWNKFNNKGKKNKAIWKKIRKIEVQCSTKKNFPAEEMKKKIVGKTKKGVKFTGLKKKTTYFVRVRYCDGAGGYSKWSAVKSVRTK